MHYHKNLRILYVTNVSVRPSSRFIPGSRLTARRVKNYVGASSGRVCTRVEAFEIDRTSGFSDGNGCEGGAGGVAKGDTVVKVVAVGGLRHVHGNPGQVKKKQSKIGAGYSI